MIQFEKDKTYREFAVFIKIARKRSKLTQKEVAERLGITQAYYHLIEKGTRQIGLPLVLNICSTLDIDFQDFLLHMTKTKPEIIRPE